MSSSSSSSTSSPSPSSKSNYLPRSSLVSDDSSTQKKNVNVNDPFRPLPLNLVQKGWESDREEHSYWIPASDIDGKLPAELIGTVFRNGPGINEVYGTKLVHPIDGDGMICALSFLPGGLIHFRSRFVRSQHRQEEEQQRKFLYRGQMGTHPHSMWVDLMRTAKDLIFGTQTPLLYRNPSNTNVYYWGGKVVSCYETSLPYVLDPTNLHTVGVDDLNQVLRSNKALAAHFRYDPFQDRLVTISLKVGLKKRSKLLVMEFDRSWKCLAQQELYIPGLNYAHDFILTKHFYIFHVTPFVKITSDSVLKIAAGLDSPGSQMRYFSDLPSRMVLIPRVPVAQKDNKQNKFNPHTMSDSALIKQTLGARFFDCMPCHIYHFATAWEEYEQQKASSVVENPTIQQVNKVVFSAVCLPPGFDMSFEHGVWLSNSSEAPGRLYSFSLDIRSETCTSTLLDSESSVEFPSVHPYRHGLTTSENTWMMGNGRGKGENTPYRDIIKVNVKTKEKKIHFSHGIVGEPIFIPRLGWDSIHQGDDDDGWIFVQCYIPEKHITEFLILDGKDPSKPAICRIPLKHHVPYGFHGTFTPQTFIAPPTTTSQTKLPSKL